ncbi:MAG: peptide deformylase [Rhodospirillaceae bacterium]
MALLPIIVAPDPRLKAKAKPVEKVDADIVRLMDDMLETMYAAPGVGLAAPQVGVSKRVIVVDAAEDDLPPAPLRMANPEIIWTSPHNQTYEEGCLSLPEYFEDVERPAEVKVRYIDHQNEVRELHATGLLSVVLQHEMDHLGGTLFVDHLSALKRNMILRKLTKAKKLGDLEPERVPMPKTSAVR